MRKPRTEFVLRGRIGESVFLLEPLTDAAREWISNHLPVEAQWLGRAVAIEHRFVGDIAEAIAEAGMLTRWESRP